MKGSDQSGLVFEKSALLPYKLIFLSCPHIKVTSGLQQKYMTNTQCLLLYKFSSEKQYSNTGRDTNFIYMNEDNDPCVIILKSSIFELII